MNMKQYKYGAWAVGAWMLFLAAASCTDSYESTPVNMFTEDYLFSKTDSNGVVVRQFLNRIYWYMRNGHNGVGGDYLDAASDDALSVNAGDPDVYKLAVGRYSASSPVGSDMIWSDPYGVIRRVNILLSGIDVVPFNTTYTDAAGNKRPMNVSMKAEARFLRAYFYFELMKRYGGIPIVGDKVYELDESIELPRSTFEQTVNYIVSELDDIKDDLRSLPLPDAGAYAHVVTAQAVQALKVRVLLYAASPLFNEHPVEQGNALVGYAAYDRERWKTAADAARSFIQAYGTNGGPIGLDPNLRDVFTTWYDNAHKEVIFFRENGTDTSVETANGPLGLSGQKQGNGRTNPTQNLVDAFLMKDGHFINESPKYEYNPQRPYDNRDPRLEYTVIRNGSNWLNSTMQTWQGGANNPVGSSYSLTGYYMRKFMGDFEWSNEYSSTLHNWVMFRYAEILLNFAEAENEYLSAPSQDVYDAIIALRQRAGIEAGDDNLYGLPERAGMTQAAMRRVIQNERRIELAFEEHRYWDIRRWRLAETVYAQPVKGMFITTSLTGTTYIPQDVLTVEWDNRRYLYPIPYSEVIKNKNMIQNPKW